jgi:hypothetical protein
MYDESKYKEIAIRKAILCSSLGLLTAFAISLLFGIVSLAAKFPDAIICGVIGLYIGTYFYSRIAGKIVYRFGADNNKIWVIGVLLAWSCVVTMAVFGSSVYFFKDINKSGLGLSFADYIFKPTFWVILIGFIPSLLLGIFWAKQMKKELSFQN